MKALVTGGAGFIGSHLADALLERGLHVRVVDNLERRTHPLGRPSYLSAEVEFLQGDVRDRAVVEAALQGVNVVFHHAAYQDVMPHYAKFFHSNVVATALLFEVIRDRRLPVEKVIVASSQSVYGEGQYYCSSHGLVLPLPRSAEQLDRADWSVHCPECRGKVVPVLLREERPNPSGPFGTSKYAQEVAALTLGHELGIPTVALRYSLVQGPRQSFYNAYSGICRIFARVLRAGRTPSIFEDGQQIRDYVHVSDVVAANLLALESPHCAGQALNVGSGRGTTVFDYARVLLQRMGSRAVPEISGSYRVGDVRNNVSSIAKMESLGWSVRKGLREILDDYLAWLDASPDASDYVAPAAEAMEREGILRFTAPRKQRAAAV